MDLEVEIKEEPVWLEGTASMSHDSHVNNTADNDSIVEVESQMSITPKVENDPLDPRTENYISLPSADIKDEIFIEEHTPDQMNNPCFKEEKNMGAVAVLTRRPLHSSDGCCKTFSTKRKKCDTGERERPYRCTVCSRAFTRKGDLSSHSFSHSGERPHTCSDCGTSFIRKSHLNTHLLIHAGQRPFHCTVCKSTFSQKSTLLNHSLTHSGERPFRCNACDRTFSRKSNLKQHELIHSSEKPFCCNICLKTFSWKSILKTHLLTHSGERPFVCNICNSSFSQRSHLKQHHLSHSGEKPHCCHICNAMFSLRSSLKRHISRHREERMSNVPFEEITIKEHQISESVEKHQ